jgi:nucleoside-diphosphate-sugar epimerase
MKVIVFGGTGWVGHSIAMEFHRAGHEVSVCSRGRKQTHLSELARGIRVIHADKNDPQAMSEVLKDAYEVVIDSVPSETSIDHIAGNVRGLEHYLHCSSTGAYAPLPFVPGDETMPFDHFLGGWKTKSIVDAKVMALHARGGFPATVLRPSYITGPGLLPLDNLGGRREGFLRDILDGVPLDLPNDGQALLHPVHVRDLAHAFLLATQRPQTSLGQIYNICLAKAVTLNRYIEITADALGRKPVVRHRSVDDMLKTHGKSISEIGLRFLATHMCFDIRKAREQLGYEPHCTTEEAIRETVLWAAGQMAK